MHYPENMANKDENGAENSYNHSDWWMEAERCVRPEGYTPVSLETMIWDIEDDYGIKVETAEVNGRWGLRFCRLTQVRCYLDWFRAISIMGSGFQGDPTPSPESLAVINGGGWLITCLSELEAEVGRKFDRRGGSRLREELGYGPKEIASCLLLAQRLWRNLPVCGEFTSWLNPPASTKIREGAFRVDKPARLPICLSIGVEPEWEDGSRSLLISLGLSRSYYRLVLQNIITERNGLATLQVASTCVVDDNSLCSHYGYLRKVPMRAQLC